jgi:hypothetical protein
MKSSMGIHLDDIHLPTRLFGGRMRFIILIIVFNILLISTLLLALQQGELKSEIITLQATRMVYEELILTETITQTRTITQVIPYGAQPD